MRHRGPGARLGDLLEGEGKRYVELRLPCFTSLSRRFNVMTAMKRSGPGAHPPGACFFVGPLGGPRSLAFRSRAGPGTLKYAFSEPTLTAAGGV